MEVERAVRPVFVVMPAVDAEHVLEVAAAEDEDPVEAVGAGDEKPERLVISELHEQVARLLGDPASIRT